MGDGAANWRPFRSVQEVRTHRPGFVWEARTAMAPGLTAFVHDAYVETVVSLLFAFGRDGSVRSVRADARHREVEGIQVATPWQGRHWRYERHDGVLVPFEGEVAWLLPDGPRPYWRRTIERIAFGTSR